MNDDNFIDRFDFNCFDLGDLILSSLGDVVFHAAKIFGSNSVKIELPGGSATIDRPDAEPNASFDNRLGDILSSADKVARQSNVTCDIITELLLVLDGWSWNAAVFRSPIWMIDHREIPINDARKIRGLEWLEGTSLEIKSRQHMV